MARSEWLGAFVAVVVLAAACGGSKHGSSAPAATLDVRLGLVRDQAGLAAAAFGVNDPSSATYGRFLSLDRISSRFGASQRVRSAVLRVLRTHGLTGTVDATGGLVEVSMTPAQARRLFHVRFVHRTLEDGSRTIEPRRAAHVPRELHGLVSEIVGLARSERPPREGSTPRPDLDRSACAVARRKSAPILKRYGISALAARGFSGRGMTVAVAAVDAFDPPALAVWTRCLGVQAPPVQTTGRAVETVRPGSDHEVELDLDTLVAAAPRLAGIETVVFDPIGWAGEPYQVTLERAGGPPDVISSSETYCEPALPAGDRTLTEWVLAAAAATGVTVVVSSGDTGSSGCAPEDKRLAVQYPASSPFVTAVGGTQLAGGRETVWSDEAQGEAGGGGVSAGTAPPPYQRAGNEHRAVPDLAYAADPAAWPPIPVCSTSTGSCEWRAIGGTSASAPLFAAGAALVKQAVRRAGKVPPGLLNALIYRAAPGRTRDVVEGSNDLFGTGCCRATPGFDTASGWGAFDFTRLAAAARAAAPTTSS